MKSKFLLSLVGFLSIATLIILMIMANNDRKNLRHNQSMYESKLDSITIKLNDFDCDGALLLYEETKNLRNELMATKLYFSIESHAQQANEIGIAECFAYKKDFNNSTKLLHIHENTNPDYIKRAATIYKQAGDNDRYNEAIELASKFIN